MNMICGLTLPSAGEIKISDQIGFLPEHPPLYENMIVSDYLKFVAKINGVKAIDLNPKLDYVIERCGLQNVSKRLIGNLSKGYKQRVGIASVLIFSPKIIILDEPTVGLDPNSIVEIRELIRSLKDEHTILLSTHQLNEANALCSHLTIIDDGRIIESGPADEIKKKFAPYQEIEIETVSSTSEIAELITNNFTLADLIVSGTFITIKMQCDEDMRAKISKLIIDRGFSMIGLKQKTIELEDLFKIAIRSRG
jgi:ABC-2 type transport system ATP-binding protein